MGEVAVVNRKSELEMGFVVASATEVQQNFSRYMKMAAEGKDVVVEKNGKTIARIVAERKGRPLLTDLVGILADEPYMNMKDALREKAKKYETPSRH